MQNCENNKNIDYPSIIKNYFGNIKRARGYYLYTEKKARLLDMFLCEGRAILGHKPKGVLTAYKRELDRGLVFPVMSKVALELKTALKMLFPEHESYICKTKEEAYLYIEELLNIEKTAKLPISNSSKDVPIYRHFIKEELNSVFLFLPYPSINTTIILYKDLNDARQLFQNTKETLLLPAEAKAISAFIYRVIAKERRSLCIDSTRAMKNKKSIRSENNTQKELDALSPIIKRFFQIKGRYLYFDESCGISYSDLFILALKNRILLSPDEKNPSIFPEIQHYSRLLSFFKGLKN